MSNINTSDQTNTDSVALAAAKAFSSKRKDTAQCNSGADTTDYAKPITIPKADPPSNLPVKKEKSKHRPYNHIVTDDEVNANCDEWLARNDPQGLTPGGAERLNKLGIKIPKASIFKPEPIKPPTARSLKEFQRPLANDMNELLKHRFLCNGGGLLLVGQTGLGKSSLAMQLSIKWGLGHTAFGLEPTKPLKSLIIQAENDDGDLAEMRDGIVNGLGLSDPELDRADKNVYVVLEDERVGVELFNKTIEPLLKEVKPDILWIDPALSFLGGDMNSQEDVGNFLRNQLNPVLHKYNCAAIVIHHTNKISNSLDKPITDPAYLGAGSAEWANWSRAVLALRKTDVDNLYELIAGKRGARLKWKGIDGQSMVINRYISHIKKPDTICWIEVAMVDAEELKAGNGKTADEVLKHVPATGLIGKDELVTICRRNSIGRNLALEFIDELVKDGSLFKHEAKRANARAKVLITREGKQEDPVRFLDQYVQDSQGIYRGKAVIPVVTHPINLVGANRN